MTNSMYRSDMQHDFDFRQIMGNLKTTHGCDREDNKRVLFGIGAEKPDVRK